MGIPTKLASRRYLVLIPILCLLLMLSVVACAQSTSSISPLPAVSPQMTPSPAPESVDLTSLLPAHARVLQHVTGDVDKDGMDEIVITFAGGKEPPSGGVLVAHRDATKYTEAWRAEVEWEITDLAVRDSNGDGLPEILVFGRGADKTSYVLSVYAWDGSTYRALKPQGGPLADQAVFASEYYPPFLDDPDFDGTEEILVFRKTSSSTKYLETLVYKWDGKAYVYMRNYIAPPRLYPTATSG